MNYNDILKSEFFKDAYSKIEQLKKDFPVNHGFIHVSHVLENAKELSEIYGLSKKEEQNLLIACALHDIGYLKGREDHPKSGAVLAEKFLKENNFPQKDISVICDAISRHGGKDISDYRDPISRCLVLADKFDFISSRYNAQDESVKNYLAIERVKFEVGAENVLKIFVKDFFDVTEFENSYGAKLKKTLAMLSEATAKPSKLEYIKT